jgi:hypothetical protein
VRYIFNGYVQICFRGMPPSPPKISLKFAFSFPTFSVILNRKITSERMRWAGHVACMREVECKYMILVGKPGGKKPVGRPEVSGRVILKCILE